MKPSELVLLLHIQLQSIRKWSIRINLLSYKLTKFLGGWGMGGLVLIPFETIITFRKRTDSTRWEMRADEEEEADWQVKGSREKSPRRPRRGQLKKSQQLPSHEFSLDFCRLISINSIMVEVLLGLTWSSTTFFSLPTFSSVSCHRFWAPQTSNTFYVFQN